MKSFVSEASGRRQNTAKRDAGMPVYLEIAHELKEAIFSGRYPVGSYLPTEEQLAADFGVSRNTIRESLRKLREDKLIVSRRGSGTRVLPPQSADSNFMHAVSINDFQSYARNWDFTMEVVALRKMTSDLASWLGSSPDDDWLAIQGVSRTHGAMHPECWVELYVHQDYAAISRLVTTHPGPVFKLVEDMFGPMIVELTQEISAELVSKKLAKLLEVEPGTPAIVVRRAFKTAEGKVVEAANEIYPASRFRYQVNLHRANSKYHS